MEVDSGDGLLLQIASGGVLERDQWLPIRNDIIERLEKIAHEDFPIPVLPSPPTRPLEGLIAPLASSSPLEPSSQEADKENAPTSRPLPSRPAPRSLEPGELPRQLSDMLAEIKTRLERFDSQPPHTVQRLAELTLRPRAHYKALGSFLHAVDRVVHVTSAVDTYPLPPAVPDTAFADVNGEGVDPAEAVSWGNSTAGSVGSDEALGGALLTPIPWLAKGGAESSGDKSPSAAQIHSESTESIEGPNGMGSIETVSVSVNGVPSTGHTRGVTQGELLRQEQRAGVVPVSQLNRPLETLGGSGEEARRLRLEEEPRQTLEDDGADESPHARGPEEIGMSDTGPQGRTTSFMGGESVDVHDIDVEAAVGRKHEDEPGNADADGSNVKKDVEPETESQDAANMDVSGAKREAGETLEGEPVKKTKDELDEMEIGENEPEEPPVATAGGAEAAEDGESKDKPMDIEEPADEGGHGDRQLDAEGDVEKMQTDK